MTGGVIETRAERLLPPSRKPYAEIAWWGMVLFIMSEGAMFAYFLASYFYLGVANPSWPPAGTEKPKLALPLIMTALLVTSSIVLYLGEKSYENDKRGAYRIGVIVTLALGIGFLLLQWREYHDKLQHVSPTEHAYESLFFTITSFHGAHVAIGLLILAWTLLRETTGWIDPDRPVAIHVSSLYWHFVDVVWLAIIVCIYLSPRFY
ncbi:MAG TPA: heme-copper oxidase subunit III [Gemmatimonadaceae bacterium]